MPFIRRLLCTSALFMALSFNANADLTLDSSQQKSLSLTIYQNGLGFVRDQRAAKLAKGVNLIAFEDVSSELIPDSLLVTGTGFRINERRFAFDLLNAQVLLEKSVGKTVSFLRMNPVTGNEERFQAKILSAQNPIIIERDGHVEVAGDARLVLDKLPEGLRPRPALLAELETGIEIQTDLSLAYLSNGLGWNTSYSAELNETGTSISLRSWANLTNTSGVDYKNVELSLAAGSVNRRVQPSPQMVMAKGAPRTLTMAMDSVQESMAEPAQALGGMHLYNMPKLLNLNDRETKQVALMPEASLKSKRILVTRFNPVYGAFHQQAQSPLHPDIELSFTNDSGQPLPDGLVRLYREHSDGKLYFIGEDQLTQTPMNSEAKLHPGKSFDVTVLRTQTDFKTEGLEKNTYEAAYTVLLKNAKPIPETVRLEETFPGQWELRQSSIKPTTSEGKFANWEILIPANGEISLNYRVLVHTR
jgi:hypothetical protein